MEGRFNGEVSRSQNVPGAFVVYVDVLGLLECREEGHQRCVGGIVGCTSKGLFSAGLAIPFPVGVARLVFTGGACGGVCRRDWWCPCHSCSLRSQCQSLKGRWQFHKGNLLGGLRRSDGGIWGIFVE